MEKQGQQFTLNDLPRFSSWPARLLGLEQWEQRQKTSEEVVREYEHEKWGPLLSRLIQQGGNVTLGQVDEWVLGEWPESLCSVQDRFELLSVHEAHKHYLQVVESTLKTFMPLGDLVELGAGYGSIILALARCRALDPLRVYAGEYVQSGVSLIQQLAKNEGISAVVGRCDLTSDKLVDFNIPHGAVIYTSMATPYVTSIDRLFVERFVRLHPRVVIHFEPCYEHFDVESLLGAMRKRYIEVNGYNKNLISVLHQERDQGRIDILVEKKSVFGINPLLPISVVAWRQKS